MAVMADGRRCYQTSEIADGTYEFRGERNSQTAEWIRKAGKFIREDLWMELRFIDYFRKEFTGCNWKEVYPLTEEELCRHIKTFLEKEGVEL
jgi:hypothetical protein